MKTPTLTPIDLSKRDECEHPDIDEKSFYLALHHGRYYAGKFTREHYGWNFDAVYDAGTQLDDDDFQALWKITPG